MTDYSGVATRDGRWFVERTVVRIERYGTYLFLLVVVAMVLLQVASRYIFADPPLWTEEFARYALVWTTFLGAAWLVAINDHITVHGVDLLLPTRYKVVLDALVQLIQGAIAVVIVVNAPEFMERVGRQHSAAAEISLAWVYGSVVIGFALIALHSALLIAKDVMVLTGHDSGVHLGAQGVYDEGTIS